jgi:F-type H+-transporting ATPase subunit a
MPQDLTRKPAESFTGKPLMIAQEGEPKKVTEGTEAKEHKAEIGTIPEAHLLLNNAYLVTGLLVVFAVLAGKSLKKIPKGFSNFAEFVAESLNSFTVGIIGPDGEKYTPIIGTIFLYILACNLIGLIPVFHSPTSNISLTLALGLFTFAMVQYVGVKNNGLGGYVVHFMGPKFGKFPAMFFLMFPVEVISELVRPLTLAIRLFGNIFGEDVILFALAGLGAASQLTRFIPFHAPVMLLSLLTALVQAMVFSTLACIYISLVSHHDDDHAGHGEHHADAPHDAAAHATHTS